MVRIWEPSAGGGEVQFTGPGSPDEWLRGVWREHNLVTIVLDVYQLAALGQVWARDGLSWVQEFGQQGPRLEADSALYQAIKLRTVHHSGEPELRRHVLNAGFRMSSLGEGGLRLQKQHPKRRIDLAVSMSMAHAECRRLNL